MSSAPAQASPAEKGSRSKVIGITAAVIALALVAAALFVGLFGIATPDDVSNGNTPAAGSASVSQAPDAGAEATSESTSSSSEQAGSTASSSANETKKAAEDVVFENESVRAALPAKYVADGNSWVEESSESIVLKGADGAILCRVAWGGAASKEDEAKFDSHTIGVVSHGSVKFTTFLKNYYLDKQGEHIYWGSDDVGVGTGLDRLGLRVEDVVSWIELYDVNKFVPAEVDTHDPGQYTAGAPSPFYGVWVGASKDRSEAVALAKSIEVNGALGAVFETTDWANLNDEPWYVVSVGESSSEAEAQALCASVQAAGYPDAYVKYTGDYVG